MGRTSKFSFPLPGRKNISTTKDRERSITSSSGNSSNLSKAQRLLGTDNDLNIDSHTRSDDRSWGYPSSSRSSGMSISISESTQSTKSTSETGSYSEPNADRWEHESGVLPRAHQLREKASSTLLGQLYGEGGATDASSQSRRMRHEGSDSTLKSYYDRQKSPLSISQQTSASSARDLALRKGFPPVIPRSPLLQVDSADPYDNHLAELDSGEALPSERSARKKPARLDLSMLFPKSRKNGLESVASSPASIAVNASMNRGSSSGRRKLTKAPSKESLQSQKLSIRSSQSTNPKERQGSTSDTLHHIYDTYEQLPIRSPPMGRIPESSVPNGDRQRRENGTSRYLHAESNPIPISNRRAPTHPQDLKTKNTHLSPIDGQSLSWKNMRSNVISPPWEISSAASVSSQNTKTSRHTSASMFSNQDLKQSSVLSLSSSSEEEASDSEPPRSPAASYDDKADQVLKESSQRAPEGRRQTTQHPQASANSKKGSRKGVAQTSPFLTIPEGSLPGTRIQGPWSSPIFEEHRQPSTRSHSSAQSKKKSSRKSPSIVSQRSSQHPTPPLSPNSVDFRDARERSNRYMAVTQQEEALLEALRQKRARMRERIIEEHEIAKSPPRIPNRTTSRFSAASSVSTLRGADSSNGERILLYLDTPLSETHRIDTAEPSPDLSDFLSFGSDEDATPRTSYVGSRKDKQRPDSSIRRSERISPMTPPSAARLSAVGSDNLRYMRSESRKRATTAVRFVEERRGVKPANPQDFSLDENERDVIWGM